MTSWRQAYNNDRNVDERMPNIYTPELLRPSALDSKPRCSRRKVARSIFAPPRDMCWLCSVFTGSARVLLQRSNEISLYQYQKSRDCLPHV